MTWQFPPFDAWHVSTRDSSTIPDFLPLMPCRGARWVDDDGVCAAMLLLLHFIPGSQMRGDEHATLSTGRARSHLTFQHNNPAVDVTPEGGWGRAATLLPFSLRRVSLLCATATLPSLWSPHMTRYRVHNMVILRGKYITGPVYPGLCPPRQRVCIVH